MSESRAEQMLRSLSIVTESWADAKRQTTLQAFNVTAGPHMKGGMLPQGWIFAAQSNMYRRKLQREKQFKAMEEKKSKEAEDERRKWHDGKDKRMMGVVETPSLNK